MLFSSHQLDLVADVSRDVVIIDEGRIVLQGDVADIRGRAERGTPRSRSPGTPTGTRPSATPRSSSGRRARCASASAASRSADELLASASAAGQIVEFTFSPPDLSEVFLGAVARTRAPGMSTSEAHA